MPGPVSQSNNTRTITKEQWLNHLRENNLKFFVLKAEDFLLSLSDDDVELFNMFLYKHEEYREKLGKTRYNNYWIINRDEDWSDEIKSVMNKHINWTKEITNDRY